MKHDAAGNCATVLDGVSAFRMTIARFKEMVASAIDESTIVSFWTADNSTTRSGKTKILLDMVAGASSSSSEHCVDSASKKTAHSLTFDEDRNPMVDDGVKTLLAEEVADVLANLVRRSSKKEGRRQCPMCPFRSFKHIRGLRTHIQKHHTEKQQYICSGTKQMKIVLALFDDAASSQIQPTRLLQQSASLLQENVQPELSNSVNKIDKHMRLVLDSSGPRYVHAACIGKELVRQTSPEFVLHSFLCRHVAEGGSSESRAGALALFTGKIMWQLYHGAPVVLFCDIESHSKVRSMVTRFHMQAIEQGNKTTTLFPTNSRHWHPIMEDVGVF